MYSILALLSILTLTSCSDYAIKNDIKHGPEIVVYPERIDFGNLLSGYENGQQSFAVINAGDEDLIINKPEIQNGTKFNIDSDLNETYIIQPGESIEFNVYYSPTTYEENIIDIIIPSNDEDEEEYFLPVEGRGDAPLMSIDPYYLDYGEVSVGCVIEETITVRNNGNINLEVTDVKQLATLPADISIDFGTLGPFPWEVVPGQEVSFSVRYEPTDVSIDESQITLESNDPANQIVIVEQEGFGDIVHWKRDVYTQDERRLVDIVFVVDNSGSMFNQQAELAMQMNDFMNSLSSMNVDFHLGFITTDSYELIFYDGYDWIDSTYSDPVDWAINVIISIGTGGSAFEQGIYYAHAFANLASSTGNPFWRNNANYAIIYISDEPDYSPGGYANYFTFFDYVKPTTSLIRQFAVIGDYPSGCSINTNGSVFNIPFGGGYYEMTQRYNGAWYSICNDWGAQMQNLAAEVAIRSSFELTNNDVMESTIEVRVNGQLVYDWVFDETTNAIVFELDEVPESGNTVEINYAVTGCSN